MAAGILPFGPKLTEIGDVHRNCYVNLNSHLILNLNLLLRFIFKQY